MQTNKRLARIAIATKSVVNESCSGKNDATVVPTARVAKTIIIGIFALHVARFFNRSRIDEVLLTMSILSPLIPMICKAYGWIIAGGGTLEPAYTIERVRNCSFVRQPFQADARDRNVSLERLTYIKNLFDYSVTIFMMNWLAKAVIPVLSSSPQGNWTN